MHKPLSLLIGRIDNILIKQITKVLKQAFEPRHHEFTFCKLTVSLPQHAGSSSSLPPFITSLHDWEKFPMSTVAPYQPNAQEIPKHIFMGIMLLSRWPSEALHCYAEAHGLAKETIIIINACLIEAMGNQSSCWCRDYPALEGIFLTEHF